MPKKAETLGNLNSDHILKRDPLQFIVVRRQASGNHKSLFWSDRGQEGLRIHCKRRGISLDEAGKALVNSLPSNADMIAARRAALIALTRQS